MGGVIETLQGQAARAGVQAPPPTPPRVVSDDELVEMLESGDARKVIQANKIIASQAIQPLVGEFINFRGATLSTAATLHREVAEARGKLPHASDAGVKRSMDAFMQQLDPAAQANPEAIQLAYAHAVAQPENLQRIIDQQVEAKLRERGGGTEASSDVATGGRRIPGENDAAGTPTVTQLFGAHTANALKRQGKSPDDFAKRQRKPGGGRFANWKEYADHVAAEQAAEMGEEEEAV
jgi:hypothetical protein